MNPVTPGDLPSPSNTEAALLVAFTRMEAKVDVALTSHGADLKAEKHRGDDHEARIRILESRPTVSPRSLWTAVISAAGLVLTIVSILDKVTQ